jgi:Leucine-rich repeat (LRR) protein
MSSGSSGGIVDGGHGMTRRTPEGGYITSTSSSIENARRFLYDEDDDLPITGNPANTALPVSVGTAFPPAPSRGGTTNLSKVNNNRRVNTFAAACMATCATCRGYGSKRLLLLIFVVGVLLGSVWGILALVKSEGEQVNPRRVNGIQAQITAEGFTSESDLATVGTPQYHAAQWLANVDGAKLRANSPHLMQRYALAVLFYSTAGTEEHVHPQGNWNSQTSWLSGSGLCAWEGVECGMDPNGPHFDGNGAVTALNLTSNGLAGSLPSELKALTSLSRLDLSKNSLVGTLPEALASLRELKDLILRENKLSGIIPIDYGLKFSNLRQLSLGLNKLHGGIPRQVEHMVNLRALGLEHNELEGTIPELEDLNKLKQLYLEGNKLNGPFPSSVSKLTGLVDLNLSDNHLTGFLPPEMEKLTRLGT